MKGGTYTKTLAKIHVRGIFRIRDIRRNVLPKIIEICMETPCCSLPADVLWGSFAPFPLPSNSFFLLSSQLSRRTRAETLAMQAICGGASHAGAHLDELQHSGRKPTETSVTEFCDKSENLFFEKLIQERRNAQLK